MSEDLVSIKGTSYYVNKRVIRRLVDEYDAGAGELADLIMAVLKKWPDGTRIGVIYKKPGATVTESKGALLFQLEQVSLKHGLDMPPKVIAWSGVLDTNRIVNRLSHRFRDIVQPSDLEVLHELSRWDDVLVSSNIDEPSWLEAELDGILPTARDFEAVDADLAYIRKLVS